MVIFLIFGYIYLSMLFSAPVIHGLQCRIRLMNHQIRTLKIQTAWLRKYIWSTHQNEVVPLKMMLHGTIWFLVQHSTAMLEQCGNHLKPCWNNVATLCCAAMTSENKTIHSPPLPSFLHSKLGVFVVFLQVHSSSSISGKKRCMHIEGQWEKESFFLHFFKLAKH